MLHACLLFCAHLICMCIIAFNNCIYAFKYIVDNDSPHSYRQMPGLLEYTSPIYAQSIWEIRRPRRGQQACEILLFSMSLLMSSHWGFKNHVSLAPPPGPTLGKRMVTPWNLSKIEPRFETLPTPQHRREKAV